MKHFGHWPELASPWDHHLSKPQEVNNLRGGLSFSGLLFFHSISAKTAKCLLLHVSNDKQTWLVQTQVSQDFHQCQLTVQKWELED